MISTTRKNRTPRFRWVVRLLCLAAAMSSADWSHAEDQPGEKIIPDRKGPAFAPAPMRPSATFSESPAMAEIAHVRAFEELLVPMTGKTSGAAENRALA